MNQLVDQCGGHSKMGPHDPHLLVFMNLYNPHPLESEQDLPLDSNQQTEHDKGDAILHI